MGRPKANIKCSVTASAAIGILKMLIQARLALSARSRDTVGRIDFIALR